MRARLKVTVLTDELNQVEDNFREFINELSQENPQARILAFEERTQSISAALRKITRQDVSSEVHALRVRVETLSKSLQEQRSRHPDTSPLRIDNGVY